VSSQKEPDWFKDEVPASKEDATARGIREREELRQRLISEGALDLAAKLAQCGQKIGLVCACCGSRKSVEMKCRRRWCPACAWIVQRERLKKFSYAASLMQWPLFVVLTVKNSFDPECIRTIRKNWSKMRRRKIMTDKITGGISTIEVTNTGQGWHPHLNILADCRWLAIHTPEPTRKDSEVIKFQKMEHAQKELSAVWADTIKQSGAVCWVKRKKPGEMLAYALKYAVKGQDLIESVQPIAPLIEVLQKSRMISAFGDLHGKVPVDPEDEKPTCLCGECGNEKSFIPIEIFDLMSRQSYDKEHRTGRFSNYKEPKTKS